MSGTSLRTCFLSFDSIIVSSFTYRTSKNCLFYSIGIFIILVCIAVFVNAHCRSSSTADCFYHFWSAVEDFWESFVEADQCSISYGYVFLIITILLLYLFCTVLYYKILLHERINFVQCSDAGKLWIGSNIEKDLKALKSIVAEIIWGLETGSTVYHLESTFKGKGSDTDDIHAENYLKFLTILGENLGEVKAAAKFSEKLLAVIKESKQQRSFKTKFLTFWIKVYCLLDDGLIFSDSQLGGVLVIEDEHAESGSNPNLNDEDSIQNLEDAELPPNPFMLVDTVFEKCFNPGTFLSGCEQVCLNGGLLWIICKMYETFFVRFFKRHPWHRYLYYRMKSFWTVCSMITVFFYVLLLPLSFLTPNSILISFFIYSFSWRVSNGVSTLDSFSNTSASNESLQFNT